MRFRIFFVCFGCAIMEKGLILKLKNKELIMQTHPEKIVASKAFAYFLQLSKTMNYTQSAKMLGITQPALTQQIKRLEKSVGASLFYSVGKQLHLTEAGKTLQKMVEDIYEIVAEATEQIQLESDEKRGKIRIGISASIEDKVFLAFIIDYYRRHTDVQIDFLVVGYHELWEGFEQNKLDLAILYLPNEVDERLQNYDIWSIAKDEIVFVHPASIKADQEPITYEKAITFPWTSYPYSYFVSKVLQSAFKKQQTNLPEVIAHFTKPGQLLKFSQAIEVCTALPKSYFLAHRHQEEGLLVSSFDPPIPMELSFVIPKEKREVPRIALFFEEFEKFLKNQDYLTYLD